MKTLLKSLYRKFFPDWSRVSNDYGDGLVARQLMNGQWVLWNENKSAALDMSGSTMGRTFWWNENDKWQWTDCQTSRRKVHQKAQFYQRSSTLKQ